MTFLQPTLLILIAAIGGWLMASAFLNLFFLSFTENKIVGYRSCGILPVLQPLLATKVAAAIEKELLSDEHGDNGMHNQLIMQELKPVIEQHVDRFLEERLIEAFPLLAKFMGEKTMLKLKEAFLAEIETIFPLLVKEYGARLLGQYEPAKLVEKMMSEIDSRELKKTIKVKAAPQLLMIKFAGAVAGIGIALLQLLALMFIQ